MYPYDFKPERIGINHREIFVVMPFDKKFDPIFDELIEPATDLANKKLGFTKKNLKLYPYRTKQDIRTTSGWINVLEHLTTAQVVVGVLTSNNPNVFYELGIAHATQPVSRQILIAGKRYKPKFDTKDLIFYRYDPKNLKSCCEPLSKWIVDAINQYNIRKEKIVRQALMQIGPYGFGVIMQHGVNRNFAVHSNKPDWTKEYEKRYGKGAFEKNILGITDLCRNGLLGLNTKSIRIQDGVNVQFSFWWTGLGNDVLLFMEIINENELKKRRLALPEFFEG